MPSIAVRIHTNGWSVRGFSEGRGGDDETSSCDWPRCADGGNGGVRVLNAIPATEQRISASQAPSRVTGEVAPSTRRVDFWRQPGRLTGWPRNCFGGEAEARSLSFLGMFKRGELSGFTKSLIASNVMPEPAQHLHASIEELAANKLACSCGNTDWNQFLYQVGDHVAAVCKRCGSMFEHTGGQWTEKLRRALNG